jgi:vanillate/3-O-methylgallate O-demethylase
MNNAKTFRTLQEFVDATPNLVAHFGKNESPHSVQKSSLQPVPGEWTNWREEQRAWRETAVLFDQTHHMPELFVRGPDALRMLNKLGINSFAGFVPGKAKQFIGCNPEGQIIGECILYYHAENDFELVSGTYFLNWVRYHAATGGYDVTVEVDPPTSENKSGRTKFRFGMDGPNAEKIFKEVVDGTAPEIPFFNVATVRIAGCDVTALRHGMAGHKGVELSGAFRDYQKVRQALLDVGAKHGLKAGGQTTYFSTPLEGGWMAYPTPAVFTGGKEMRAYREWLPADSWEPRVQLGGSFQSANIEDYYVTPYDMGYDRIVKFDHDFIGREALERMAANPRRTAVTLVWNHEDILALVRTMFEPGLSAKYLGYPLLSYSLQQNDAVRTPSGELVGTAANSGYTINEHEILSLALIDRKHAAPGTELVLTWGEPNGGLGKPHVERHKQMTVRVRVEPKPYSKAVQTLKSANIR